MFHFTTWICLDYTLLRVLQNSCLPFSFIKFIFAWILRELLVYVIFIKAISNPKHIKWGKYTYRISLGGLTQRTSENKNTHFKRKLQHPHTKVQELSSVRSDTSQRNHNESQALLTASPEKTTSANALPVKDCNSASYNLPTSSTILPVSNLTYTISSVHTLRNQTSKCDANLQPLRSLHYNFPTDKLFPRHNCTLNYNSALDTAVNRAIETI